MKACKDEEFRRRYGIHEMTCAQFIEFYNSLEDKKVSFDVGENLPPVSLAAQFEMFLMFTKKCKQTLVEPDSDEDSDVPEGEDFPPIELPD